VSWPLVELGTVAVVSWGNTSITKESYRSSGFPAFSAAGEDGFLEIHENDCDGIVLSAIGARCGRCFKASGKWTAIKNTITILEREQGVVCLQYLFHFLSRANVWPNRGGAQPFIALGDARKVKVPLPPLPEQKRIAAILDKADAIRRKRQQAIQLADNFLRAVFLDMFGDPVTNPKGWEMRKWCNVLKIVNGKNQKAVEDEAGAYPICGSGGFMAKANNWLTEANSVIIGRKGNINSPILMRERFWNVDTAFGLEPKREALSHNYLFWFCKFFDFEQLNKAVTIPSLTKTDLLQIDIPLPPRDVQGKFDEVVERIDMLSAKNEKTLSEQLFESLSQKAFSGQL